MVRGLDIFREHFREYTDSYVLIGGTACDLAMGEVGMGFRATKDLDVVLCVELLDKSFVAAFWAFIRQGGYQFQGKAEGKKRYYRFQRPTTDGYPVMLELFSRALDTLPLAEDSHLTPIPVEEDVSSLSAILLNDDYYEFLHTGKRVLDGLSFVGPEHLLPLKARAWLDLSAGRLRGEPIDSNDIRKHRNDVFRLYQIVSPDFSGTIPGSVKNDLKEFISRVAREEIDLKSLGLAGTTVDEVLLDIRKIYRLD